MRSSTDAALTAALAAASAAAGESVQPQQRGAWQANQIAIGPTVVAYVGADPPSRARIRAERIRLAWAADAGVPVPAVRKHADDDAWLLVERVPDDEVYGPAYVDAALAAAAAVRTADEPPVEAGPARPRRASRRDLLPRLARAALSPLRVAEFRALRAEVAALPESSHITSHGDFHIGNVLSHAGQAVSVVDFEFLGRGHPADDLMSLWVDLIDPADRDRLLGAACDTLDVPRTEVLLHAHWLAVRHLAELVTGVALAHRDRHEVKVAVERVQEARALRRR